MPSIESPLKPLYKSRKITVTVVPLKRRRWTVIISGLLCGVLAVVVLFTNRAAFFSPLAVVVVAAIGLAAVLFQLRLRGHAAAPSVRQPLWLNLAGTLLAVAALLSDLLHEKPQWTETLALGAVAVFAISGAYLLRAFRKSGGTSTADRSQGRV
jgi:drug/metabolite transporter (DMT)-like permease